MNRDHLLGWPAALLAYDDPPPPPPRAAPATRAAESENDRLERAQIDRLETFAMGVEAGPIIWHARGGKPLEPFRTKSCWDTEPLLLASLLAFDELKITFVSVSDLARDILDD